jgi:calcineurin-like phosphoesterase family protein
MNRIFVIADTHFGHSNIIKYEPVLRPFTTISEHDEALVEYWNETVKPADTVWHLGDVLFGAHNSGTLKRLNGIKKLVMGNHDVYHDMVYTNYFCRVCGTGELKGYILSHVPVHPGQFPRFKGNIHGHMHSKTVEDTRYACVSVEQTNLRPIQLDQVIARLEDAAQQ